MLRRAALVACLSSVCLASSALAADVTPPAEVRGLLVERAGDDLLLSWDAVGLDATGNLETVAFYEIWRGTAPGFVPDRVSDTNLVGTSPTPDFVDTGAAADANPAYHYLVSAVDADGNEGPTRSSTVLVPPTLDGFWTDTTIELDWAGASPLDEVVAYKVYRGRAPGTFEYAEEVGLDTTYTAIGLEENVNWHFAVTAIDAGGNETAFSNEHVDPVGGVLTVRAHDESELCWGAAGCTPTDSSQIQRSDGFQLLVPADFPVGDWTRVDVTFTMDSRLCTPPAGGNVTKCGSGNPCVDPPCNGGYNTCGDPWDRTAHLFLVLDDCVSGGQACMNHDNIELMRAVTPFGTDALPPDGTGAVRPRSLTLDVTPFTPLLAGQRRYVGAHIGHFVQKGWWVTSEFRFSKRPEETSPKPPANGIAPVFFHTSGSALTGPFSVNVPPDAQHVIGRLFITGHGGNSDPTCANPADEFCQRTNRLIVDSAVAWQDVPWRDCCYPRGSANCSGCTLWNACGYPSCTFDRSGWCPGEIACHDNLDEGCDQDLLLTDALAPGQTHDVEYQVVNVNGSWSRSLVVYWYDELIPYCGNDAVEAGEVCDGTDLDGASCQTQGFDTGLLACRPDCDGYDLSGCRDYACGNTICETAAGENCLTCPADCNGVQGGNPSNRYCCGAPGGDTPVGCDDTRCFDNGVTCEP